MQEDVKKIVPGNIGIASGLVFLKGSTDEQICIMCVSFFQLARSDHHDDVSQEWTLILDRSKLSHTEINIHVGLYIFRSRGFLLNH